MMRMRFLRVMILSMAFAMYAVDQGGYGGSTSSGTQANPGSSTPSSMGSDTQTTGSQTTTTQTTTDQSGSQTKTDSSAMGKEGKTLKGCIVSQGGTFMLQEKN